MDKKKTLWKIRLRPDGTWENVYGEKDTFYEMDPAGLVQYSTEKRMLDAKLKEFNELQELKDELIDLAMQAKGMSEAYDLINRIKNDGPRDSNSV
jgi:hypothetical protein